MDQTARDETDAPGPYTRHHWVSSRGAGIGDGLVGIGPACGRVDADLPRAAGGGAGRAGRGAGRRVGTGATGGAAAMGCDADNPRAELRQAAQEVYAVFAAPDLVSAVAHINTLLARYATAPRLTAHDQSPWHLHVDPSDHAPWHTWFVTSSAMALAILVSEKQRPPGGLCAAEACGRPFVDLGQGGGRRYCSARCATRERVASHRRKQG